MDYLQQLYKNHAGLLNEPRFSPFEVRRLLSEYFEIIFGENVDRLGDYDFQSTNLKEIITHNRLKKSRYVIKLQNFLPLLNLQNFKFEQIYDKLLEQTGSDIQISPDPKLFGCYQDFSDICFISDAPDKLKIGEFINLLAERHIHKIRDQQDLSHALFPYPKLNRFSNLVTVSLSSLIFNHDPEQINECEPEITKLYDTLTERSPILYEHINLIDAWEKRLRRINCL